MKEYITAVAAAVVISEIVLMLMPDGGMKKFARIASGVLLMTMVLSPVKSCSKDMLHAESSTPPQEMSYGSVILDVYNEVWENTN